MSADDMRVITGPLRLERLREELRKVAIGADKVRFVMRDLASQRERIAENTANKIKEVKKDHSYSTRPPEKRQEVLRDLERTLAGARNNAKIFKQVEIELGDIAIAANKAELRLKDYAGAFINVSGSKDAIDSAMVNILDTAWRKVGEAKDIYDEFITQLPVKYLLDLPLKQISAAKETLGRLRDGRLRLVKEKAITGIDVYVFDGKRICRVSQDLKECKKSWKARSGKPVINEGDKIIRNERGEIIFPEPTSEFQNTVGRGPIPEGDYTIHTERITDDPDQNGVWKRTDWNDYEKNRHIWQTRADAPRYENSWGEWFTRLTPGWSGGNWMQGNTGGRFDFNVHGGDKGSGGEWGSAGCIDLMEDDESFFSDLMRHFKGKTAHLIVDYSGRSTPDNFH